jgi:plastocyanin domain-containing protein
LENSLVLGTTKEAQVSPTDGVQKIDVIVDSYSFDPDHIVVTANKPVELTLKSVTTLIPHNFTIDYPDAGLNVDEDIPHGKDVKVTFTPTKPGNYEFYCDKKFLFDSHKDKGMKGVLEVKP